MQAKGFEKWPNATDAYGFSALPAGCGGSVSYYDIGEFAHFWSATEFKDEYYVAPDWDMAANNVTDHYYYKGDGVSVRCVKDSE